MTNPQCPCGRPITDNANACTHCGQQFARALGDITALAAQLRVTLSRQDRIQAARGRTTELDDDHTPATLRSTPLPFHYAASEASWNLRNSLVSTVRLVAEQRAHHYWIGPTCRTCQHESCEQLRADRWPDDTETAMATWLLHHTEWIRHHEAGHEWIDETIHVVDAARPIIDTAASLIYAGPCRNNSLAWQVAALATGMPTTCPGQLYVAEGAAHVECEVCGQDFDVPGRRAWMLDELEEMLLPASVIVSTFSVLGEPVTAVQITRWKNRADGRLVVRGVDLEGHELFRGGDVLDLAREHALRAAKRRGNVGGSAA